MFTKRIFCVLPMLFTLSSIATAEAQAVPLKATPDSANFFSMDESVTIRLMYGDAPLSAETVKSVRIMIDNRDYSEQFFISRSSSGQAAVTIRPNPKTAQVGSFTLRISTALGEVTAAIRTPFDKMPGMLENRAKAQGITVEQLKAKLGMTKTFARNTISIDLPESFIEGYVFDLSLPDGSANEFTWTVDGKVVLQGPGKSALSHVFERTGEHVMSMVEKKGEATVTSWEGVLKVVAHTPMKWSVPAKVQVKLPGPEGFKEYMWCVNGKEVSSEPELIYTFPAKGTATIECVAQHPEQGNPAEFRHFTWETTVK